MPEIATPLLKRTTTYDDKTSLFVVTLVVLLHGLVLWGLQHMAVKPAQKTSAEVVVPIHVQLKTPPKTLPIEPSKQISPKSAEQVPKIPTMPSVPAAAKTAPTAKLEKANQTSAISPVVAVNTAEAAIVTIAKLPIPQTPQAPTITPSIATPAAESAGKPQDKPAGSNVDIGAAMRSAAADYSSSGNASQTADAKKGGDGDTGKVAGTGKQVKVSPSTVGGELTDASKIYPRLSKTMGEQGSVYVRFFVNVDGTAENLEISRSSGFERLDQAALEFVKQSRYIPGSLDGVPSRLLFARTVTYSLGR